MQPEPVRSLDYCKQIVQKAVWLRLYTLQNAIANVTCRILGPSISRLIDALSDIDV